MAANYEKGMYNQLMDVMERLSVIEKNLHDEKIEHKDDVDQLNTKIDSLTQENVVLRNDNARLKSIIDNDSSNTSLPPSSDEKSGKSSNTFNGRKKTEKKSGGQHGHKGTTMTKAEVEEKIKAGRCRHEIRRIGNPSSEKFITKYVVDLAVETVITEVRIYADVNGRINIPPEYRSDVIYGADTKALTVALYSEGVMSNDRIAAFLNAASGNELNLSSGSVYGFCKKLASNSERSIQNLEQELLNQKIVSTDATNVTVNGKQSYIRNFSIESTVLYRAMKDKKIKTMKELEFMKKFAGILMHDHETALYHFGTDHAECNVHILRYLRKNTEDTSHQWSEQLVSFLCDANKKRKELIQKNNLFFSPEELYIYEERYKELIEQGREENKDTRHKYAKKDETTLLNRLEKYRHNHLLFLYDFKVPFDDNMSERDLRKVKNRQKMAGGFRKDSGQEMYCTILSIIETLKRRKMGLIENIKKLFIGTPAIF